MRARPLAISILVASALGELLLAGGALAAPPSVAGTVTFVAGDAIHTAGGKKEKVGVGASIHVGDVLETGTRTRVEVKLEDQSILRLGPFSRIVIQVAAFGKSVEDRKVSAKLLVGKVWANVARTVGGEARFEVRTENAVAGVRGTTFRVDAATDESVVVKVYSGTVAVAAGAAPRVDHRADKPEHRQISGPRQVSREQWEKIVTTMMEVRVSADGVPSEPESFALASTGVDEWEDWNRTLDAAR